MSLTFCEQAAIALFASGSPTKSRADGAARLARDLAEACCAEWWHDWTPVSPGESFASGSPTAT